MTTIVHEVRPSLLGATYSYRFEDDALHWQAGRSKGQIAFADITRIRLVTYVADGETQGQCTLKQRSGKPLKIRTHHYNGLGDFEDRTSTYSPFIRELCRRAATASPQARFLAGSSAMWYVWLAILVLCCSVSVLLLLALSGGAPSWIGMMLGLAFMATAIPFVWRQFRRGGQKDFDPQDPPADLLDSIGGRNRSFAKG